MESGAQHAETAEEAEGAPRHPERFWFDTEFMLWRIKGANLPPLVTTGASTDPLPGALGSPNTKVLFGGPVLDFQDRSGGRFTLGWWPSDEQPWGVQATYFFLAGRAVDQTFASPGNPVLAVPFFNPTTGAQDAAVVTYPGYAGGHIAVDIPSFLQSIEGNLTANLWHTEHVRVEALVGFRYLNLNEGVYLQQVSNVSLAPQFAGMFPYDGNTITISDRFDTRNSFYGGQVGLQTEFDYKRFSFTVVTKVALGDSHEQVSTDGSTNINTHPATLTNAGMFAVGTNSGQFSRNRFAAVPELGLNLGFQLTNAIKVSAGYSFLYWSSVARPGDQIDTVVNPNLISNASGPGAGPLRPAFLAHYGDFFAHGVNLSFEFRY